MRAWATVAAPARVRVAAPAWVEVAVTVREQVAALVRERECVVERTVTIGFEGEARCARCSFFPIGLGSTSFGRFGWTGAFRIYGEYSLSRNESTPSHPRTER